MLKLNITLFRSFTNGEKNSDMHLSAKFANFAWYSAIRAEKVKPAKRLWFKCSFELTIGVHVAGQHVYECRVRSFLKSHFFETYFATTLFFCTFFWAQIAYIGNSRKMAETFIQICIGADFRVVIAWQTHAEAEYHVISEFYKRGNELQTCICQRNLRILLDIGRFALKK